MSFSSVIRAQSHFASANKTTRKNGSSPPLTSEEITRRLEAFKASVHSKLSIAANDNELSPLRGALVSGPLAKKTMDRVLETLAAQGKRPSNEIYLALNDQANTLESMANGVAPPTFFGSSLDPGTGKTLTIKCFLVELKKSNTHRGVGAIVFLDRHADIRAYYNDLTKMGLTENDIAIVVPNNSENTKLNALGNQDKTAALVLLITHKMQEVRTRHTSSFNAITEFHYEYEGVSRPRMVRAWDEACWIARPVIIPIPMIRSMLPDPEIRAHHLHGMLTHFLADIEAKGHDEWVHVPDFEQCLPFTKIGNVYLNVGEKLEDAIEELWRLSGGPVGKMTNEKVPVAVTYISTLAPDLAPMMIADASVRLSGRYTYWELGERGNFQRLRSGAKSYRNAKWFRWKVGGSRNVMRNPKHQGHLEMLLAGSAELLNREPDKRWLIGYHANLWNYNGKSEIDIVDLLSKRVVNPERLNFVYYGSDDAKATNAFEEVDRVLLFGTPFYSAAHYAATLRLSKGLLVHEKLDPKELEDIRVREHLDKVFQFVGRSAIRRTYDSDCGECEIYCIADDFSGIPGRERDMFPGIQLEDWYEVEEKPRAIPPNVTNSLTYIDQRLREGEPEVLAEDVASHIGQIPKNFIKRTIKDEAFRAGIADLAITLITGKGSKGSVFVRLPEGSELPGSPPV